MNALMSDYCAFFFNLNGTRAKGKEIVTEDTKRVGLKKVAPIIGGIVIGKLLFRLYIMIEIHTKYVY